MIQQYLSTVRPMHFEFVEPSKRYADVILPRGGNNAPGVDVIAARIRERLGAADATGDVGRPPISEAPAEPRSSGSPASPPG